MVQPSLSLLAAVAKRAAPRLRKAPIVLTDAAAERIKTLLEKRNKVLWLVFTECFVCPDVEYPDICGVAKIDLKWYST